MKKWEEEGVKELIEEDRAKIAENCETLVDTLIEIMNDGSNMVLCALARNNNLPQKYLRQLSKLDDYWVNNRLLENSSTPKDLLVKVARQKVGTVFLYAALDNPNIPKEFLVEQDEDNLFHMARNPATPLKYCKESILNTRSGDLC